MKQETRLDVTSKSMSCVTSVLFLYLLLEERDLALIGVQREDSRSVPLNVQLEWNSLSLFLTSMSVEVKDSGDRQLITRNLLSSHPVPLNILPKESSNSVWTSILMPFVQSLGRRFFPPESVRTWQRLIDHGRFVRMNLEDPAEDWLSTSSVRKFYWIMLFLQSMKPLLWSVWEETGDRLKETTLKTCMSSKCTSLPTKIPLPVSVVTRRQTLLLLFLKKSINMEWWMLRILFPMSCLTWHLCLSSLIMPVLLVK